MVVGVEWVCVDVLGEVEVFWFEGIVVVIIGEFDIVVDLLYGFLDVCGVFVMCFVMWLSG